MEDDLLDFSGRTLCTVTDSSGGVELSHDFQRYRGYEVELTKDRCTGEDLYFSLTLDDEEATELAHKLLKAVERRQKKLQDYLKERSKS